MTMASAGAERRWSSSSNPKERFPDLDSSQAGTFLSTYDGSSIRATTSRTPSPAKSNGVLRSDRWQPRKEPHLTWENGPVSVSGPREHGRQKSLSEAFQTIRSRRASVSENAHEIAEALKAPISYKIIVGGRDDDCHLLMLTTRLDSLPCLVLDLCVNQYFLKIDPQRLSETDLPYHYTIRFRVRLVPLSRIPCAAVSTFEDHHTSFKERHSLS